MELKIPQNNDVQTTINSGVLVNTAQFTLKERLKYIEEDGRQEIYKKFSVEIENRNNYLELLKVQVITFELIKTFIMGIDIITIINLLVVNLFMYICLEYNIIYYATVSVFITSLIIPLSFLITADYQRQDEALSCLADIRGRVFTMALHYREFGNVLKRSNEPSIFLNKLKQFCFHLSEFVFSLEEDETEYMSKVIYQDISDLSQLTTKLIDDKPSLHPRAHFASRLFTLIEMLIASYERLRLIKLYRTSHPVRSFAKVMTFLIPIIIVPIQAYYTLTDPVYDKWTAYFVISLQSIIMGILISLHDKLYNPFLTSGRNSIRKDELLNWITGSLEKTFGRHFDVHQFCQNTENILHYRDSITYDVLEVY